MDANIFPLPFSAHLIFVAVAFIFFMIQFVRNRYIYQLNIAIAAVCTMLVYANNTREWFYGIGILEFGILIISLIDAIAEKQVKKADAKADEPEKKDEVNISDATAEEKGAEE